MTMCVGYFSFLDIRSRGQGKGHVGAMQGGVDTDLYSTPTSMGPGAKCAFLFSRDEEGRISRTREEGTSTRTRKNL